MLVPDAPDQAGVRALRLANYLLRRTFWTGNVVMSPHFAALPARRREQMARTVRQFAPGVPGPWDDTAGGVAACGSLRVRWWFAYYGPDLQAGSGDPANPRQTRRVMVLDLAPPGPDGPAVAQARPAA